MARLIGNVARVIAGFGLAAVSTACTESSSLDTGDVLVASFAPGIVYTSEASGAQSCDRDDNTNLHLLATHADGTPAGDTTIQLWLTGTVGARLSVDSVVLSADGTSATVCMMPGSEPGTATLHARSGVIETTTAIEIRALEVPVGGKLVLTALPAAYDGKPMSPVCGAPTAVCTPGAPRAATVVVHALPSQVLPVPRSARVVLTTDRGWLSRAGCGDADRVGGALPLALEAGTAQAVACFPDHAGTANLVAHSGALSETIQLDVGSIPRSIDVVPLQTRASVGAPVSFLIFASDCEEHGVPNVVLALHLTSGEIDLDPASAGLLKTGPDGSVTITGVARALPLALDVEVLGAMPVSCHATIEGGTP